MPANLTPQYYDAEQRYKSARTPEDKIQALKEMLSIMPKHKGTEKLQGDIKKRIARLREETEHPTKGKKGHSFRVERQGVPQVTLVGVPNVGKSRLLDAVTHATPEVADYPFTTRAPQPAMMAYKDIQLQLIDLPPVCEEHMEHWVPSLIRSSDMALLFSDLASDDCLDEVEEVLRVLKIAKVELVADEPEPDPYSPIVYKKTNLIGTKVDAPNAPENLGILRDFFGDQFPIIPISAETGENLDLLKSEVYSRLAVMRIYTKRPGEGPDRTKPYLVAQGSTVEDFATHVHKDFAERLKYARVWGHGKFDGQRVTHDHVLFDGDVVEMHI